MMANFSMLTRRARFVLRRSRLPWALAAWVLVAGSLRGAIAEEGAGERIYRGRCASCHGAAGEGSADYPRSLAGDRSPSQLARLIAKTMPEDDPGTCLGPDAEQVAAYIHEAFYSRAAQARTAAPRIELSRLTVAQYRNAVADLIGNFREPGTWGTTRGLRGQYFRSSRIGNKDDRVFERVDPEVRFDFGNSAPGPEKFEVNRFSIRWDGSVLAPETGEYEFLVRTEHAARLWVNDLQRPLVDAWVKSGDDTEFRGSIHLLGGRAYPLRLEFSKARQGVDDSKRENKSPATKASIALEWKLPHRTAEPIPARDLTPDRFPEGLVAEAAFPPDDRSIGYERATTVSKAWDQATTEAAIEVAGYVAPRLRELAGVADDAADRAARLRDFGRRFAERAFRRPLTADQQQLYIDRQFAGARDPDQAIKRVVLFVLKSPRFLYREAGGSGPDPYAVASRIAFGLWDSLPDRALLDAAAAGQLGTREQVARQAERMAIDLRAHAKLREFLLRWLKVEQVPDLAKDPARYPGFDAAIASDLRTSLDLFLEDVAWGDAADFRQLLLADSLYLNGRLARFYGADLPPDAPFQKVLLEPRERAGLLSHPYLMATFAYTGTSSPIHRGVFVIRSVLGRSLRPPPQAVAPLPPEVHAGLTTRERVTLQTGSGSCLTCHGTINPLGFGLEHFDAVGRFRDREDGKTIDASGVYEPRSGDPMPYSGARELAALLAASEETQGAFVEQLFHHLVKQPIRAYGHGASSDLRKSFADRGFHIRKLMVEIIATAAIPPGRTPGELPADVFQAAIRED